MFIADLLFCGLRRQLGHGSILGVGVKEVLGLTDRVRVSVSNLSMEDESPACANRT